MALVHTSNLSDFVQAVCAANGDFNHPDIIARFMPLTLKFDTSVDQDLSPYSTEYFEQQLALYREIAGRDLNQETGELHPGDLSSLVDAPNPTGVRNAGELSDQIRTLSAMISLSCFRWRPRILDMGAGAGLSSETFAFAGCRVHAIDIDPGFGALARERAKRRGFEIERSEMNFDHVSALENDAYRGAYFFQSLHHCMRPWDLIETLGHKIQTDGVIAFAGEPIQSHWWRHWGLRLDFESLFVARQHGWFESGWSHEFIKDCFARNGFTLMFFTGGYAGGEIGMAARAPERLAAIREKATQLGLREVGIVADSQYHSTIGRADQLFGRPAFRQHSRENGVLLYGPYAQLAPGKYELSLCASGTTDQAKPDQIGTLALHAMSELGKTTYLNEILQHSNKQPNQLIVREILVERAARNFEICATTDGDVLWTVSLPIIRKL